jgi:hypothetical protein
MADGHVPPQGVRDNAQRGLDLRSEFGRGGTAVGIARARDLARGASISYDTIKRMNSFFARHEVDKKGENWGNRSNPSNGYIAWLLWGGDAGWSWAKKVIRSQEAQEKSTMANLTTSYFGIEKADRNPDGTLVVYGKATDDSIDIDQQICDADWLDRAMPHWFKSGGNIREQHSNIAAGVAKEYEVKGDGHYITALVVDPVSVKKVEAGVLKGFSVGIKNPRVVRDVKAANGRIVDGQIVEVSLVDRPANPNCQLVLAKSAGADETVVQVEELREIAEGDTHNSLESEATEEQDMKAAELIESAKKYAGTDITKFDAKAYETARNALANLIAVEAKEIEDGHDERASLSHLLNAVAHLFAWYEGEEAEGEVMETEEREDIELAAKKDEAEPEDKKEETKEPEPDKKKSDDEDEDMTPEKDETEKSFMKRCKEAGKSDAYAKKCWDKYMAAKGGHKSADVSKCLECGCNQPGTDHGLSQTNDFANVAKPSHVTTAEMYAPGETPKSVSADEPKSADVEAIIEEAVKSATQSIRTEIAALISAKEAAESKAMSLETELATAKSLAVAGGPKRTARPVSETSPDLLVKAAAYKAKAQATTDPTLAKGYKTLAEEYLNKAAAESGN